MVKVTDIFYAVATGPRWRRVVLTPVGLLIFGGLLLVLIWGSLATDRALGFPPLLPGSRGVIVALALLGPGLLLWGWCVMLFRQGKGTPVPFNPPRTLVVAGPYAWVRNPMLSGVFASLFGVGFVLHSVSAVFVWVPAFVLLNVLELKLVEEPELERRFGDSYKEYRRRVPMFLPRVIGRRREDPPRIDRSS